MTPEQFRAWRMRMADFAGFQGPLSERKTAALLGCTRTSVRNWTSKGAPLYVALACSCLAKGFPPWGENSH
jgi:hypothetical protein